MYLQLFSPLGKYCTTHHLARHDFSRSAYFLRSGTFGAAHIFAQLLLRVAHSSAAQFPMRIMFPHSVFLHSAYYCAARLMAWCTVLRGATFWRSAHLHAPRRFFCAGHIHARFSFLARSNFLARQHRTVTFRTATPGGGTRFRIHCTILQPPSTFQL